jgi:hypothetical protein
MDKKTGFITGNKPHSKGGIDVIVKDTNQVINVESKEYQICKSAMESTNILFYKDKTNIEILDDIHKKYNCPAFDKTAKSGDFIVCKIAVADDKPRRRVMGTASQIVNAINGLAGGRVDGETAEVVMEKGGKIKDVTCSNCGWSWNKEDSDKHDEYVCHKCGNDNTMERGGKLIKRANGTYSKRGLWDNIRENASSGKKPTKQMLEQEARIKANTMEDGGSIETTKPTVGNIIDFGDGKEHIVKVFDEKKLIQSIKLEDFNNEKATKNIWSFDDYYDALKNREVIESKTIDLKESREKSQKQYEQNILLEQNKKEEYNDIDGYGENLKPIEKGKALLFLNSKPYGNISVKEKIKSILKLNPYIEEFKGEKYISFLENNIKYSLANKYNTKTSRNYLDYLLTKKEKEENLNSSYKHTMEDGGTILLAPNDEQIKIKWSELSDSVKNDIVGNIWDNNKYVQENYWNSNSLKDAIDDLIENYQPLFKIEYKNTNYLYNQLIELNWSISEKNIENLIEKIEDGIILDPIILNNGLFFDGGHRLTSYKRLKIENIPTIDIGFMLDFNYEKWDNGEIDFNSDTNFKNGGGVLLAPNGQPSNLTAEQYKLVRTPEFIKFFGNWEKLAMAKIKDPAMDEVTLANLSKDVSKVVDSNGEPLAVWHVTDKDFFIFDKKKSKEGFFFSANKERLKAYNKKRILTVFLNIKNPSSNEFKRTGFDGIIDFGQSKNTDISSLYEIIAFYPNQIKLADGTNTTFDANNDDIRFEQGGTITDKNKETYAKWKSLVNMSESELKVFYDSEEGKKAGLTQSKANKLGIDSGRESARMIMKMKDTPVSEWSINMWKWANKQISFISRMSGNKGGLYDENGNKTRKHTSLLIWGHNPEKYEKGGSINSEQNNDIVEFKTYDVQVGGNSHTESIYGGYDLDEAKRKFNQADLDDLSTSDKYSGGVVILEEKINKYKFIYDLGEDENIEDFPIEDYYEDDSIYELIEEGEYKEIETRDIIGEKDIKEQNEEQADELLNETINYFKKLYPRYTKAGYVNRESYYFLIPIPNTDNTIELRLSNHSPNFDNIDSNKNEVIKTELVRLGENPKEIDISEIDFYDQVYDNDMGFVKYRQIKPKNRVALINCVIYHTLDETYSKFDKNTEYNIINEYFDLNERDYELSDITEKIEEIIQEQIDEYEYNETIFKKGGKISKELKKGIKVEKEHKDTAKKLYNHEISIDQAPTEIAKDHIQENPNYYDDLEKSRIVFEDGGLVKQPSNKQTLINTESIGNNLEIEDMQSNEMARGGMINRRMKFPKYYKAQDGKYGISEQKYGDIASEEIIEPFAPTQEDVDNIDETYNVQKGIKLKELFNRYYDGTELSQIFSIKSRGFDGLKLHLTFNDGSQGTLDLSRNANAQNYNPPAKERLLKLKDLLLSWLDKDHNQVVKSILSIKEKPIEPKKEESIQKRTASFEKTADNFSDIRQSLDEFFTPEWIAEVMFKLAQKHGFNGGKILEPSFGHGVFFDVAKKYGVSDNDMFGFEIYKPNFDYVKNNYPKAKLFNHNFEYQFINKDIFYTKNKIEKSLLFNDTQFDLVVGNPPYGKHRSPHAYYFDNKLQIRIEGFFVYLGLKKLKKGGLLIYIVNSLWLQNGDMYNEQKKEIAKLGDLIDAYRLPNKLFKDTDIATDILIFRKK